MNNLEIIKEKIKSLLTFAAETAVETATQTIDVETADGNKYTINAADAVVGADIYSIDGNGVQTPVADGEYVLTDGRTIVVANGKITEVKGSADAKSGEQTPVEPAPVDMSVDTNLAPTQDQAQPSSDLEARVNSLEEQLAQILYMLDGLTNNSAEMMSKVNKLSAAPSTEGIVAKKKEIHISNADAKLESIKNLMTKFRNT
jgi:hypothetical protein